MSIHNFVIKIKGRVGEHKKSLILGGILALTAILSFYIGYVARAEGHKESLVAITCPANAYLDSGALAEYPTTSSLMSHATTGAYVASKNGKKYYPASCSAANRIKDQNKIFFTTTRDAEQAGYSVGAGCSSS